MVMFIRLGLSTIVGVVMTLGLFYLMQYLIQGADSALTDDKIGNLVDFVRVKQDQQVETKQPMLPLWMPYIFKLVTDYNSHQKMPTFPQ